ncbi:hypothetical protein B0A49_07161 [Cryomyces minteri]|uniref:RRM domain-containing protein n=1 Tax=Cryomyces minteri TaxID=331657 RepID=A0A4U0WTV7_9PEZI|nr:hypothetical protein B0A49_07161 [Cryomyces minteri]
MRDGASGRSRGFGFLTFKDPKTVNIVMVKEHYLDGKIIDPKRAIPRDEQERTSKIFVGGVSQEATEQDFKSFFMNFGRVLDATLMMDKDTGRPRGFGFVTFDSEAAVDRTLEGPLQILGKQIEVKKAQPRGNLRDNEDDGGRGKFNRFGNQKNDKMGHNDRQNGNSDNQQNQNQQDGSMGATNGMSPAMMAQYWQRMQQYFAMMQQQMAASIATQGQGMTNPMMGGQMNPAMMQQMMAMQQQQQNMGGRGPAMSPGGTPGPQSPGSQGMPAMAGMQGNMNLAMVQQMQQMQAQQMMAQQAAAAQAQAHAQGGYAGMNNANPNAANPNAGGMISPMPGVNRPAYNAQEQLAFEQQKYERQQAQRLQHPHQQAYGSYGPGAGPTSWEGMYDDVAPPPAMVGAARGGAGGMQGAGFGGRQMSPAGRGGMQQNSNRASQAAGAAPANAPTGPKNAGVRGANYRGGGRGAHRGGFHPYQRGG